MGLKERLRETAQQAQEGLAKGQAKLEQYQNRQSANDQLQALGQAYWVQQSGRATPEQLHDLLATVRPAILDAETRFGQLTWPTVPADPSAAAPAPAAPYPGTPTAPASTVPTSTVPTSTVPTSTAAPASAPLFSPSTASAPDLAPSPGQAATAPPPAPSGMPTAIHHDPPPAD